MFHSAPLKGMRLMNADRKTISLSFLACLLFVIINRNFFSNLIFPPLRQPTDRGETTGKWRDSARKICLQTLNSFLFILFFYLSKWILWMLWFSKEGFVLIQFLHICTKVLYRHYWFFFLPSVLLHIKRYQKNLTIRKKIASHTVWLICLWMFSFPCGAIIYLSKELLVGIAIIYVHSISYF